VQLSEVDIVQKQLTILSDLMNTLIQLQPLTNDLSGTFTDATLAAAEQHYQPLTTSLDNLIAEAKAAPDTPSKLNEFLGLFRSEMTDIKGIVDGARAHNVAQVQNAVTSLQKDLAALQAFDANALQQQYKDLGNRLDDKVIGAFNGAK
jgi:hypothetical protein